MLSVVYTSLASAPMTDADLALLLLDSRNNNTRLGLTGVLLFEDGQFLQVLEGPDEIVRDRYARILADPRHADVQVFDEEQIDERRFPEWTMGFLAMTSPAVTDLDGFDDYFSAQKDGRGTITADRVQQVVARLAEVDPGLASA